MQDAILPRTRRAALEALIKEHEVFFPPHVLTEGIRIYTPMPSTALFDEYVEMAKKTLAKVGAFWTPKRNASIRPVTRADVDALVRVTETLGEKQYESSSVNNMVLHLATIRFEPLRRLADEARGVVIKSQSFHAQTTPEDDSYMSMFEFTNEVIVSRLLNLLVIAFPHTVTPHFTTFLGSFLLDALDGTGQPRMHGMYERATLSLGRYLDKERPPADEMRALVFQIFSALEAAQRMFGLAHNDLHNENVMLRDVTGTPYANKIWAYKRQGDQDYYYIRPEHHKNMMVEIIDLGRATLPREQPGPDTEFKQAMAFGRDVFHILHFSFSAFDFVELNPFQFLPLLPSKEWLRAEDLYSPERKIYARDFFRRWASDEFFMGTWFAALRLMPPISLLPTVVLMSLVPNGNIVSATQDMLPDAVHMPEVSLAIEGLQRLWKVPQGHKRTREYACATCRDPNVKWTSSAEPTKHFCGQGCFHVYSGLYETV